MMYIVSFEDPDLALDDVCVVSFKDPDITVDDVCCKFEGSASYFR